MSVAITLARGGSTVSWTVSRLGAYRDETASDGCPAAARRHLEAASDALSMALLTLGGEDDDAGDRLWRGQQARAFLAEAITGLSRARIYIPSIRSHAMPVLMMAAPTPEAELKRLHNIATRLLWQNHAYLPARLQAKPLAPEEEAQLARVLAGLARNAKIDRALRYKWAGLATVVAAAGAVLGLPLVGVVAATSAVGLVVWHATRGSQRLALPPPPAR